MNPRHYLMSRVAVMTGIALIGAMTGFAVSLNIVQTAAINQGIIIPGYPVPESHQVYSSLRALQTLANTSGAVGALLLGAYGIHEYRTMEKTQ